jgi:type II secretory pathway component GspD/PulD (secretin)
VIGGLFREKDVTMRKKVPGLGDIPGLGVLFSARSRERVKSELVFIMTITQVK